MQKGKTSEEALQIAKKRREANEKRKNTHLNAELQRIAKREKKAFHITEPNRNSRK